MARDLSFWKYDNQMTYNDAEMYLKLSAGMLVEGVADLPIDRIYTTICNSFSNWNWNGDYSLEYNEQGIEIYMNPKFVRFDCYSVSNANMNLLIDIMRYFECPLYDAAISTRFSL